MENTPSSIQLTFNHWHRLGCDLMGKGESYINFFLLVNLSGVIIITGYLFLLDKDDDLPVAALALISNPYNEAFFPPSWTELTDYLYTYLQMLIYFLTYAYILTYRCRSVPLFSRWRKIKMHSFTFCPWCN